MIACTINTYLQPSQTKTVKFLYKNESRNDFPHSKHGCSTQRFGPTEVNFHFSLGVKREV
jgi:hypothetical protein